MEKPIIRTIGHSTRPVEVLIDMLKAHGVNVLIDVRTIPKSRQNPQYNREALEEQIHDAGLGYEHMKSLGGLRHPRKDSRNMGWRNDSFRGYADYMQTPEFAVALEALLATAARDPVAIMCAEAVPWRCHRSLISDILTARGYPVEHIMSATQSNRHTLTSFARVEGTSVTYPPETDNNRL
ncbi:MAG TPA: DUF488 domain-containing protein [Bryobacteraceae bacterium]|nr:DUF488 domain-containing protein [Bryobacteraceae bacterium]